MREEVDSLSLLDVAIVMKTSLMSKKKPST